MAVASIVPANGRACQELVVCKAMQGMELGRYLRFTRQCRCTDPHIPPISGAYMRVRLLSFALCVLSAACASTGAVPRPFPTPGGPAAAPAPPADPRDPESATPPLDPG